MTRRNAIIAAVWIIPVLYWGTVLFEPAPVDITCDDCGKPVKMRVMTKAEVKALDMSCTGGAVTEKDGVRTHTFTSSDTLRCGTSIVGYNAITTAAGGGGGGSTVVTYPVTLGAGPARVMPDGSAGLMREQGRGEYRSTGGAGAPGNMSVRPAGASAQ